MLSLPMQIYTWVTDDWRIKDHPWNVTCVWSSRPEPRQGLERGTASISTGPGQKETWNQAEDSLRKTDLEQCCDHCVGGLKVFPWHIFVLFILFYLAFFKRWALKWVRQHWKQLFAEWQKADCLGVGCDSLSVPSYLLGTACKFLWPVRAVTCCFIESGSTSKVRDAEIILVNFWSLQSTVGLQDEMSPCRRLLETIGTIIPLSHHLWIKSSKLLSWDLERTINKKINSFLITRGSKDDDDVIQSGSSHQPFLLSPSLLGLVCEDEGKAELCCCCYVSTIPTLLGNYIYNLYYLFFQWSGGHKQNKCFFYLSILSHQQEGDLMSLMI